MFDADHVAALQDAAASGELPDGRIATQERLAGLLGFSRRTIAEHCLLQGLQFPRSRELMSQGGQRSAYQRRLVGLRTMEMSNSSHRNSN